MRQQHTITIKFQGDSLTILIENGQLFVAIRPIADSLMPGWSRQLQVIKSDAVLSSTVSLKYTVDGKDGKRRKMVFLPLEYLQGWLFKINPSKCRADRRAKIIEYQRECFHVLHDYFWNGGAINPEAASVQLQVLQGRIEYYQQFTPADEKGTRSKLTGNPRNLLVRSYYRAHPRRNAVNLHPDLLEILNR